MELLYAHRKEAGNMAMRSEILRPELANVRMYVSGCGLCVCVFVFFSFVPELCVWQY